MKKCPACAEEIQEGARVCRYCKTDVARFGRPSATGQFFKILGFCIAGFFGLILLLGLFGPKQSGPRDDEKMRVSARFAGLEVSNASFQRYSECDWTLNGDYELSGSEELPAGKTTVPWERFSRSDGTRFDFPALAAKSLHVHCRDPRTLTLYVTW